MPTPYLNLSPTSDPIRWRILIVVLVAIFMSLVGISIVNVTLPSIQQSLDASQSDIQWVLSGYALTFGVVLVSAGRAGDILGRGGFFLLGVAVFTLASIGAGLAPNAEWLKAARLAQGLGSGLLNPQGIGMIQQYFQGKDRNRAFGYFGTTVGVSVALGPVLGGVLIKFGGLDLGWRLTFLINVPLGALAFILGFMWFPRPLLKSLRTTSLYATLRSLDPVGALLFTLAVLCILLPFIGSQNFYIWLLLPLSLVLFYLWIKWEKHYIKMGHEPMVDLKIFNTKSYTNGILIMVLYFLGMTSIWVLVAIYIQQGAGGSAFEASLVGIPGALLSAYTSDWAGKRIAQFGRRIIVGGLIFAILGLALSVGVILLHEFYQTSLWWLLLSLSFLGLGQGAIISPNQAITLAEVPVSYAGSAGAIMQTAQRVGASVGLTLITAIFFAVLNHFNWTMAISVGFIAIILVMALALIVAIKDIN